MKKSRRQDVNYDLEFTFRYANVCVEFAEFDQDGFPISCAQKDEVNRVVRGLTNEITIDRTYVQNKNSLYSKTLIDEDEWKLLCELEHKTNYGRKSNQEQHQKLVEIYSQLIMSYVALGLSDFGYDLNGIFIYMKDASKFMVEIYKNKVKNYNYFGKWQTW